MQKPKMRTRIKFHFIAHKIAFSISNLIIKLRGSGVVVCSVVVVVDLRNIISIADSFFSSSEMLL